MGVAQHCIQTLAYRPPQHPTSSLPAQEPALPSRTAGSRRAALRAAQRNSRTSPAQQQQQPPGELGEQRSAAPAAEDLSRDTLPLPFRKTASHAPRNSSRDEARSQHLAGWVGSSSEGAADASRRCVSGCVSLLHLIPPRHTPPRASCCRTSLLARPPAGVAGAKAGGPAAANAELRGLGPRTGATLLPTPARPHRGPGRGGSPTSGGPAGLFVRGSRRSPWAMAMDSKRCSSRSRQLRSVECRL